MLHKIRTDSVLSEVAQSHKIERSDVVREYHKFAGFVKHADRDPHNNIKLPCKDIERFCMLHAKAKYRRRS